MIVFSNITLRVGTRVLLNNANAAITPGQKVGLIGKNGAGKSTLLSLIKGDIHTDEGTVTLPTTWRIASVAQETPGLEISALDYVINADTKYRELESALDEATSINDGHRIGAIYAELETIDAWTIRSRAAELLHGLGFNQRQVESPIRGLSGGWRMRLNLAQALLCPSELLLLDEPTNHLDLDAVIWLEKWLKNYCGTLILISHDRDFLDPVINKILHITNQSLIEYTGNYSNFEIQRATKLMQHQSLYRLQQQKIAHLQSYITRFSAKASKAKQAQSRIKMLAKMEKIAPAHVDNPFHFVFKKPDALPNPLLIMENAIAAYNDHVVLENIKLNLMPGSRIGLLGRNGAGKSTLIKLLSNELSPVQGHINLAKGTKIGYFAQHQLEILRGDHTALWHLTQLSPTSNEQERRHYLGGFGFSGEKVLQTIMNFSGGEKARLVLALIIWQKPNLLLLDEPTNHLDLDMRYALTEALIDFQGALILVSHDRHLLRSVTDEFYLVNDKQVIPFDGDLEDYQSWLNANQTNNEFVQKTPQERPNVVSKLVDKRQKRGGVEQRIKVDVLRKQITKLEKRIAELSCDLQRIERLLSENSVYEAQNREQLTVLLEKQMTLKKQIQDSELIWCEIQQQLDETTRPIL